MIFPGERTVTASEDIEPVFILLEISVCELHHERFHNDDVRFWDATEWCSLDVFLESKIELVFAVEFEKVGAQATEMTVARARTWVALGKLKKIEHASFVGVDLGTVVLFECFQKVDQSSVDRVDDGLEISVPTATKCSNFDIAAVGHNDIFSGWYSVDFQSVSVHLQSDGMVACTKASSCEHGESNGFVGLGIVHHGAYFLQDGIVGRRVSAVGVGGFVGVVVHGVKCVDCCLVNSSISW